MKNFFAPLAGAILLLATMVGYIFADRQSNGAEREEAEEGKAKRGRLGISYADKTFVADSPSYSLVAPGFNSERAWSGQDDWEPAVAVDPNSAYVYQLTTRYSGSPACNGCPFPVIIFRSSSDGGTTWSADKFLAITKKKQNDPQIKAAANGAIYAAWLDDYTPGIKFVKSTNYGATWSNPIAITGKGKKPNWSDKPILAVSPDGRDVYIAFNASDSYIVSSHDFGQSFSNPVKTNSDARYWFHTGGAVSSNGDVYFTAVDYSQDYKGDSNINVLKSADGGISWTSSRVDISKEMPSCEYSNGCYLGFFGPTAALAIDNAGKIMIAYSSGDIPSQPQKLYVRTSIDGIAWSARLEVSNGSSAVNNAFPGLAAGITAGDFRLAWQDDRNGSAGAWNSWYRRTTDGGNTWSEALRISDLGSGAPYKNTEGYRFPYGDYLDIAVDPTGTNHFIWGEGDSFTGPGGTWYARGQ